MIKYEDQKMFNEGKRWANKIILAPNACGKSTVANKIYNQQISKKKTKPKLFTMKTINELVGVNGKNIFVGEDSKYKTDNIIINEQIIKYDVLKKFVNKYYDKKGVLLKNRSYFFKKFGKKNMDSDGLIDYFLNYNDNNVFMSSIDHKKEIIETDLNVNIDLMDGIEHLIKDINYDETKYAEDYDKNEIVVPKEVKKSINLLSKYMKDNKYNECILCGNIQEGLIDAIEKNITKYVDYGTPIQYINYLYEIYLKTNKKTDNCIEDSWKEKLKILINYKNDMDYNSYQMYYVLLDEMVGENKLYNYVQNYKSNLEMINKTKLDENIINDFFENIIKEFKKLVTLNSNINIKHDNECLYVEIDNVKCNILDVFSLSEIRRLCLAVLKSEVKYLKINYLIFDDPVDSCDSYFMVIAAEYIANMMGDNIDCVLFTHYYDFLYYLAYYLNNSKYSYYMYYQDPSIKIKSNTKYEEFLKMVKITRKDIINFNNNEIEILYNIATSDKFTDDMKNFSLLAMIPTMRGLVVDINKKQSINYYDLKNKLITYDMIEEQMEYITANYLHYSKKRITQNKAVKLLNILCKDIVVQQNNHSMIYMRNEYLKKEYKDIEFDNKLLKLVLYKMLRVQNIKYKFEKKLITYLETNNININLDKQLTLGSKIEEILKYNKDDIFIKSKNIHDKYNVIINEYSHSTRKLLTPYIMSNSYDIAKLEYLIDNL